MRISSPGTQIFPGNSLFQLFLKISPVSSHSRKKASFWGGTQIIIPGWSMPYIRTSIRFLQASGQPFSVIVTPRSRSGRAECECLSYVHRFQLIFHSFMPSLVLSCSRLSNIEKPVLLCSADSDFWCTNILHVAMEISNIQRYKVQSRTGAVTAVRCSVSV